MTEPGYPTDVSDADRAELEERLAGGAPVPVDDASEADALDQQLSAQPGEADAPLEPVGDREADPADVLEQELEVPEDEADEAP
ncbi:MAG TPA: hypothetical protein VGN47_03975 [Blastococcus sp.]|nr:hypothetical protein [Blastococcus sp.]